MEKRIINRDTEMVSSGGHYPMEEDKRRFDELFSIAWKMLTDELKYRTKEVSEENKHNLVHGMFNFAKFYALHSKQQATLTAVEECFKIAESISFDTEDQAGTKFIAVDLDELREKLKNK